MSATEAWIHLSSVASLDPTYVPPLSWASLSMFQVGLRSTHVPAAQSPWLWVDLPELQSLASRCVTWALHGQGVPKTAVTGLGAGGPPGL